MTEQGLSLIHILDYLETPNAQLMAYRRIVKQSDMLLAVYDRELASDSAEDKACLLYTSGSSGCSRSFAPHSC